MFREGMNISFQIYVLVYVVLLQGHRCDASPYIHLGSLAVERHTPVYAIFLVVLRRLK